jgi:hypothetical protein
MRIAIAAVVAFALSQSPDLKITKQCMDVSFKTGDSLYRLKTTINALRTSAVGGGSKETLDKLEVDVASAVTEYGLIQWQAGSLATKHKAECGKLLAPLN